ncbi:MAG: hypothetical protein ABIW47_06400 [Ginsengibacter sp.]
MSLTRTNTTNRFIKAIIFDIFLFVTVILNVEFFKATNDSKKQTNVEHHTARSALDLLQESAGFKRSGCIWNRKCKS